MKLSEWTEKALNMICLWDDDVVLTNDKGVTVKRNVARERRVAMALITCANPEEFYNTVRQLCPVSTEIDEYSPIFDTIYNDKLKLVEIELTKSLLEERFNKSAKILLDVLQTRIKNWKKEDKANTLTLENKEGAKIIFEIA